jgi:phosphoglycerate dehydrogenase-like enzyme
MDNLNEYLPTADILIACLPETPQTLGLIDESLLSQLPSHALFVNVGRGSAVDELALIALLNKQTISGAVLDVTLEEPLPKESPLWEMPNVLLNTKNP